MTVAEEARDCRFTLSHSTAAFGDRTSVARHQASACVVYAALKKSSLLISLLHGRQLSRNGSAKRDAVIIRPLRSICCESVALCVGADTLLTPAQVVIVDDIYMSAAMQNLSTLSPDSVLTTQHLQCPSSRAVNAHLHRHYGVV